MQKKRFKIILSCGKSLCFDDFLHNHLMAFYTTTKRTNFAIVINCFCFWTQPLLYKKKCMFLTSHINNMCYWLLFYVRMIGFYSFCTSKSRYYAKIVLLHTRVITPKPALGVSKSVRLVAGRLGFYSRSSHTKDLKNGISSFRTRRLTHAEVRRVLCMCCSSCMYLSRVQSFVIDNCNGPPIENGINNVCLHPLFRTFTFYYAKACSE